MKHVRTLQPLTGATTLQAATLAALAVAAVFAGSARLTAQAQQDFSQVQIKTNKVANNFYTLDGQGGTIGVLTGPDGVLMVDAQFAPLTDKIVAAIKQISDGRIRFLINTHVHGDHTGGNENLGKMGVTILARENLRDAPDQAESRRQRPAGRAGAARPRCRSSPTTRR